MNLLIVFGYDDLVSSRRFERDDLLFIVEHQFHFFAADISLLVVVVLGRLRRRIFAAVHHSQHDGVSRIAVDKTDNDLVFDFRPEKRPAVLTGVERTEPAPRAFVRFVNDRDPHLDAVFAIRISFEFVDHSDLEAGYGRQQSPGQWLLDLERLGKPLRVHAELDRRFPIAFFNALADTGDVQLSFKPVADAVQLDDVSRLDVRGPIR